MEARENMPQPLPPYAGSFALTPAELVAELAEMGIQPVDTTGDTLPDGHLLTVDIGEVGMEPV